jgi:prolipoprotein diacylglyceryltransferase
MTNEVFVLLLLLGCSLLLAWGVRVLPRDGWQMLATLPLRPLGNGQWQGVNLTWYGLLTANAYLIALAILIILLGAVGVPLPGVLLLATMLLALCVPASKLMARIVEGKAHTFTVGGAVFVGIVVAPWMVLLVNRCSTFQLPVLATLAAIGIAYAFGEGLGRLACISFGCCYGKPLFQCGPRTRHLFRRWNLTFFGATRKIAYASGLEGEPTLPVQALTAILYVAVGLLGTEMFLQGNTASAFVLVVLVTQGWRVFSETQRADYRGENKFSAYQLMGVLVIPYALLAAIYFPAELSQPMQILLGLECLWQPGTLIFLQVLWLILFLFTGRSSVTGANLSYHVHRDRI